MLKKKALHTILKYRLLDNNDKILIGLSGGADSVCLFYVLNEIKNDYNLEIECAHINHQMRKEADEDAAFVQALCDAFHVKLHILKTDVLEYAKNEGLSAEEAGRIIRYRFFSDVVADRDYKIATAHTKNDNEESVLMQLIKGNIPIGIPAKRKNIVRPLIEVTKAEILSYLGERQYCEDVTNHQDIYFRNAVRLHLVPYIKEKFNSNFTNTVYNVSDVLLVEKDFFDEYLHEFLDKHAVTNAGSTVLKLKEITALHLAFRRRLLRKLYYRLADGTLSYQNIADMILLLEKGKTGKRVMLPGNVIAEIAYEDFIIRVSDEKISNYNIALSINESQVIAGLGLFFTLSDTPLSIPYDYLYMVSQPTVTIRNKQNGDKVEIHAKEKIFHKNVSDIFTDKKVPKHIRAKTPVILENSEIIIIPGIYNKKTKAENYYLYIGETTCMKK